MECVNEVIFLLSPPSILLHLARVLAPWLKAVSLEKRGRFLHQNISKRANFFPMITGRIFKMLRALTQRMPMAPYSYRAKFQHQATCWSHGYCGVSRSAPQVPQYFCTNHLLLQNQNDMFLFVCFVCLFVFVFYFVLFCCFRCCCCCFGYLFVCFFIMLMVSKDLPFKNSDLTIVFVK